MKPYEEMTDAELSEAFALEVAGWSVHDCYWQDGDKWMVYDYENNCLGGPKFATSADAVLPWLEKPFTATKNWKVNISFSCLSEMHYVTIYDGLLAEEYPSAYLGVAPTFARAACLALLKAKRSEA